MDKIGKAIHAYLKTLPLDMPFNNKELNHMVFLAYYDKRNTQKNVQQLSMHRDQRWTKKGEFMTSSNSQERRKKKHCYMHIDIR